MIKRAGIAFVVAAAETYALAVAIGTVGDAGVHSTFSRISGAPTSTRALYEGKRSVSLEEWGGQ